MFLSCFSLISIFSCVSINISIAFHMCKSLKGNNFDFNFTPVSFHICYSVKYSTRRLLLSYAMRKWLQDYDVYFTIFVSCAH